MSRPKPNVIMSYTDPKSFKTEQVLEATAIYAVYCDGKPFNLKSAHGQFDEAKYKKTMFPNPGHAFNLAQRLNGIFRGKRFTVVILTGGEIIEEETNR